MKMKNLLLLTLATLGLTSASIAQNLPNYVSADGLVGWWPFNGNANDESEYNNNGTVNGASLTSDRFGNLNSAFSFNNSSQNHINIPYNSSLTNWVGTLSLWLNTTSTFANEQRFLFGQPYGQPQLTINGNYCNNSNLGSIYFSNLNPSGDQGICSNTELNNGNWQHIVALYSLDSMKIFINAIMQNDIVFNTPLNPNICNASLGIGGYNTPAVCGFSESAGQFFNGIIDDIGIWNRALNQQEITDLYNSNMGITGFNSLTQNNTIKMFPNPANDHITIDYGNFATVNGYQLKIQNSIGQQVFQTNINQQTDYLSLSNWGGNGIYFVHIIDAQGNTIDIRKIVLQ
jgi:hypothetical protein